MSAIGEVRGVRDGLVLITLPQARVGDGLWICSDQGRVAAQIVSFDHETALAAPCGILHGLRRGDAVVLDSASLDVVVGTAVLGRVMNANGEPLDGGPLPVGCKAHLHTHVPATYRRVATSQVCATGVRAIDAFLTIARGARIGLFGAPGAGKSTLLQMLAQGVVADAVVVAAIGERGREAAEWARCVDERTTVIIETSDAAAGSRLRAAWYATAHAAALCRRGLHVVLVLDSLARVGAAQRELGVAMGEPVGRGGYPASVVPTLARLLEVAGAFDDGSMTVIATVLSDGDERDPLSEAARSLLDGHIVLSPQLASAGHFPAIDILASVSRTMGAVVSVEHREAAARLRKALSLVEKYADARALGIPILDLDAQRAEAAMAAIEEFLCQRESGAPWPRTLAELVALADTLE